MAKGAASIKYEGRKYNMDGRHDVAVRELRPGQGPSENATHVTPHTESGKRAAGWRMEWVIFLGFGVILFFSCLGVCVFAAPM